MDHSDTSLESSSETTITSTHYPLDPTGPLCDILADPEFLYAAYSVSGLRPAVKSFCKKSRWPGKPPVPISLGEEHLKGFLTHLFSSPEARDRLAGMGATKSKTPTAPLHQAIWGWLLETRPAIAERFKDACHERKEGLLFLDVKALEELLRNVAEHEPDEEERQDVARTVLAFAMLQPGDAHAMMRTLVTVFPDLAVLCGVEVQTA